jgi:hypothetical protein
MAMGRKNILRGNMVEVVETREKMGEEERETKKPKVRVRVMMEEDHLDQEGRGK